ncbi:hypothetical protein Syn6312_2500 [Synechococcus sp. PCC 6312]|nr:hypothetical protein Syn6312_2500 [Synechococcus sp. PCC 6312]
MTLSFLLTGYPPGPVQYPLTIVIEETLTLLP